MIPPGQGADRAIDDLRHPARAAAIAVAQRIATLLFCLALPSAVLAQATVTGAELPPVGSEAARASNQDRSSAMQTPTVDQQRVVDALRTMYVAATNDDLALFHSVAARGFYAYDVGKRYTGDELMAMIKDRHEAGVVFVWRVTEPEVRVDGNTAWITYVNRGSITDASGARDVTWLESAVLQREQDRWRIQFFHSTRVP